MELSSLLKSIAWTFVHSFWLGLLFALLAAGIITSTRRSAARLRYNLLGGVMIIFMISLAIVFVKEIQSFTYQSPTPEVANIISNGFVRTAIEFENSAAGSSGMFSGFEVWFNENLNWLMLVWGIFFIWNCLRLIAGFNTVQGLRVQRVHSISEEWFTRFEQLKEQLGIKQGIGLIQSELVKVPVAIGYFKPIVLLPVGMIANIPAVQVEAILLHELAHIRRKDFLINLVQHFVDGVFFFNPAARWISSLIRQEREACCDDIVINNTGRKGNYMDALISFQEYSLRNSSYVMAISSKKNYLFNRIRRIATSENKPLNIMEKIGLVSGLLIFSAFTIISKPIGFGETAYIAKENSTAMIQMPVEFLNGNNSEKNNSLTANEELRNSETRVSGIDTIPAHKADGKKDQEIRLKKKEELREIKAEAKAELKEKESDAKETVIKQKLEEIRLIKEEILASKEIIGKKKKALNEPDPKKREIVEKELKKEREELEEIRVRLENKRVELDKERKNIKYQKPEPAIGAKPRRETSPVFKKQNAKLFSSNNSKLFENKTRKLNLEVKKAQIMKGELNSEKKVELKEKVITKPTLKKKPIVPGEPRSPSPTKSKNLKPSSSPAK